MTPLEMIAEWRKGCSIAGPASHRIGINGTEDAPEFCPECTRGLIDALEAKLKEPMDDIVRIIRVLEYVGPRDVLEKQYEQNAVKGQRTFGPVTIREGVLGQFPETLRDATRIQENSDGN